MKDAKESLKKSKEKSYNWKIVAKTSKTEVSSLKKENVALKTKVEN